MSSPRFDTTLGEWLEAIARAPLDAVRRARLREFTKRHAIDTADDLPRYLIDGLGALAHETPLPWQAVPGEDRGHSWLLREVANVLPGSRFVDADDGTDYLVVAATSLALAVADRGADERWGVVRSQAGSPAAELAENGSEVVLARSASLAQLVDLAANPDSWKRDIVMRVVDRVVTLSRPDMVETMTHARDLARATGTSRLTAWAEDLDRVISHAQGAGPTELACARELARILMIGHRRSSATLEQARVGEWWSFRARQSHRGGRALDLLYVHAKSGALRWSADPLTEDELAAVPTHDRMAGYTDDRAASRRRVSS